MVSWPESPQPDKPYEKCFFFAGVHFFLLEHFGRLLVINYATGDDCGPCGGRAVHNSSLEQFTIDNPTRGV